MSTPSSSSAKERKRVPLIQKSLSVVLASLQGEEVKIELKDDSEIFGTIETVGHGMDMKLLHVGQKRSTELQSKSAKNTLKDFDNEGKEEGKRSYENDPEEYVNEDEDEDEDNDQDQDMSFDNLDSTLLRGDRIRFVHIPPHINITSHLSQYMRRFESRNFKKIKIVDRKKMPRIEGERVINMTSSSVESSAVDDRVGERSSDS